MEIKRAKVTRCCGGEGAQWAYAAIDGDLAWIAPTIGILMIEIARGTTYRFANLDQEGLHIHSHNLTGNHLTPCSSDPCPVHAGPFIPTGFHPGMWVDPGTVRQGLVELRQIKTPKKRATRSKTARKLPS